MAASRRRWCDLHAVGAGHLVGLLVVVSCLGGTGVAVVVPGRGDEPEDAQR